MATEFEVGGHRYRSERMRAQTETRILKRFMPLLSELVPLVLKPGSQLKFRQNIDVSTLVLRGSQNWGRVADGDLDFIERASLRALSREVDGEWLEVWPEGRDEPAFTDINGVIMETLMGYRLGFMVKAWVEGGGDAVPAEFRAAVQHLH